MDDLLDREARVILTQCDIGRAMTIKEYARFLAGLPVVPKTLTKVLSDHVREAYAEHCDRNNHWKGRWKR